MSSPNPPGPGQDPLAIALGGGVNGQFLGPTPNAAPPSPSAVLGPAVSGPDFLGGAGPAQGNPATTLLTKALAALFGGDGDRPGSETIKDAVEHPDLTM
jgi:hypothetical protein